MYKGHGWTGRPASRATHFHDEVTQLGRWILFSHSQSLSLSPVLFSFFWFSIAKWLCFLHWSANIHELPSLRILSTLQRLHFVSLWLGACFLISQSENLLNRNYPAHRTKNLQLCGRVISVKLFFKHGSNTHSFLSALQNKQFSKCGNWVTEFK